jgi:hypothetical protein
MWNEIKLQSYIDNSIEESLTLDYKAADSLALTDRKKKDITKDISAMANSAGGLIIYGLREYNDQARQHLVEHIDPIDRSQFSKEWLEQVINNIRPRIDNVIIHSVGLSSGTDNVAYVVEIPQSTTAHQATDHRYYKRFNFLSQPMEDYEIRDIMNRATTPDMSVEFSYMRNQLESNEHRYTLGIKLKNLGSQVIDHFQLQFTFPSFNNNVNHIVGSLDNVDLWTSSPNELIFVYRSKKVCFPDEEIDIGREIAIQYRIDGQIYANSGINYGRGPMVKWTLYADHMTPKTGTKPFEELQCF